MNSSLGLCITPSPTQPPHSLYSLGKEAECLFSNYVVVDLSPVAVTAMEMDDFHN